MLQYVYMMDYIYRSWFGSRKQGAHGIGVAMGQIQLGKVAPKLWRGVPRS